MTRQALFAITAAILGCSETLLAQENNTENGDAPAETIGEVMITATKRATSLEDTPLPVTAITSDALEKMGVAGFEDYFAAVPNLSMIDVGPGQKRYSLRGVQGPGEAQVGLYYDEIPVTGPPGESLDSGSQQPDIKLWDRKADWVRAAASMRLLDQLFEVPKLRDGERDSFIATEIIDTVLMLSMIESGRLTAAYVRLAKTAAIGFLAMKLGPRLARKRVPPRARGSTGRRK